MPDWEALRVEYVSGKTSYKKLAAKHGVPLHKVEERARDEAWMAQKRQFRRNVVDKALKKMETQQAGQLVKLQHAADKLAGIVEMASADEQIFLDNGTYSHKALQATVRSLKELTEVIRDLYDMPGMRQRLELERERVALEKARAGDSDADGGGVIEIGAVLPEEDAAGVDGAAAETEATR